MKFSKNNFIDLTEPVGIGARDPKECLMLQLERKDRKKSLVYKLVKDHLDELGSNKLPKITKAMGISMDRLHELMDEINHLSYTRSPCRMSKTMQTF